MREKGWKHGEKLEGKINDERNFKREHEQVHSMVCYSVYCSVNSALTLPLIGSIQRAKLEEFSERTLKSSIPSPFRLSQHGALVTPWL